MPHAYERLLLKLEAIGVRGHLLQWVRCFLISCLQRVMINGKYSSWLPVQSNKGPRIDPWSTPDNLYYSFYMLVTFTLLYIILNIVCLQMICHSYKDASTTAYCTLLQQALDNVVHWSRQWQLQLNCSK